MRSSSHHKDIHPAHPDGLGKKGIKKSPRNISWLTFVFFVPLWLVLYFSIPQDTFTQPPLGAELTNKIDPVRDRSSQGDDRKSATPTLPIRAKENISDSSPDGHRSISNGVDDLIHRYSLQDALLSIKIVTLPACSEPSEPKNQTVYERNADGLMSVASNVKLFSSAAALCRLTPDFKFFTTVFYDGGVKNNLLTGNLVVKSNGDPNISGRFYDNNPTAIFEKWADKLASSGIKTIRGALILDESAFDKEYYIPSWPREQFSWWYCAPISAISYNDNCVEITVYLQADKVKYSVSPPTQFVNISLDVDINNKLPKSSLIFDRAPQTNNITISGTISPQDAVIKEFVTVSNPPLFFGTVFREVLTRKNILLGGKIIVVSQPYPVGTLGTAGLVKVAEEQTDLATTIKVINQRSQNFYAEQLLKTLSFHYYRQGTFSRGLEVVRRFISNEVGIPEGSYFIADGSGLSRENWFSANQIVQLLHYLSRHKYFTVFRESLNSEKWQGNPDAKRTIWAKTGYLKNSLVLSGYALTNTKDDTSYIFSLI
ncbi:MAG: D-alanyl-D-alanine carboxypeptidase/D-alanyl-D-alanine-endopeptidase, partial [Planctomycetota bacterium]|nr:D-alanyl-D-alanine carboxypeptidase/D-alanyl-D-alanine-endopeptidase [Planctomycetota bacterium]